MNGRMISNLSDTSLAYIEQEDDNLLNTIGNIKKSSSLIQIIRVTRSSQYRRNPFCKYNHKSKYSI